MAKTALHLEKFLPYRLSVVTNRISGALSRHYADRFGIGIPEWRVIANLGRHPGITANDVVEQSAMDKVTVSRAVAALESKGLLARKRDIDDKRKSRLTLSAKDGIGEPSMPPRMRSAMSSIWAPPRKLHGSVRFVGATSPLGPSRSGRQPSPRPSSP